MEELIQLSESMMQASALLADEDVDEKSPSRRTSTFLNVVALGNVVLLDIPSKIDSARALERAVEMRSI
ncbi:Dynamin-2A [Platanthera guangdongensis]|uniref:Dynamin-2A n=1 Tax=Platanthera guangdongensis TaxID=2320717 RepID=A0ABR2LTP5_9ASPA